MISNMGTEPTNTPYTGPSADARAAAIEATLGTDAESLVDTVWLLRYVAVRYGVRWKSP